MQDDQIDQEPVYLAPLPPQDVEESEPLAPLPTPEPIPPRRSNSGAYPVQFAMTDDLRDALDRWDSNPENPEAEQPEDNRPEATQAEPVSDDVAAALGKTSATKKTPTSRAKTPSKRTPKASAYLNSEPPAAPRRSRKKQDTRDWLC